MLAPLVLSLSGFAGRGASGHAGAQVGVVQAAVAIGLLIGGLVAGLVVSRVFLGRLRRTGRLGHWAVIAAAQDVVVVCCSVAGAYAASLSLPLDASLASLVHRVLLVVVLFAATVFASRLAAATVRRYALRSSESETFGSIFLNVTRLIVFVIGFLIVLQTLGISITPLLTALGVGGLAVALALKDTLSNLFAGIHLIAAKYVKGGDYVKLDSGEEGYVVDINWRQTSLRQLPDNLVLVPNARLASAILTNYHEPRRGLRVPVEIGVSYDSDLDRVERVTLEVAREVMREVAGGVPEFEPWVWFHAFGDFSIDFNVYLRASEFSTQYPLKHEFIKRLHARYQREGIEIPFPIQTLRWAGNGHPPPALSGQDDARIVLP